MSLQYIQFMHVPVLKDTYAYYLKFLNFKIGTRHFWHTPQPIGTMYLCTICYQITKTKKVKLSRVQGELLSLTQGY